MEELVKISVNEREEQVVSGRDLHYFLEVGTQYTKWFEDEATHSRDFSHELVATYIK